MKITRVSLKPLKKLSRLDKFRASNCVFCGVTDNTFTVTFQIGIELGEAVMQDLVMDFSNIRFPKAYISKPYICDNAESEDYGNEEESTN